MTEPTRRQPHPPQPHRLFRLFRLFRPLGAALVAALVLTGDAGPGPRAEQARPAPDSTALREELRRLLLEADLGRAQVGVVFVDVDSGEVLFEHQPDAQLNPASNAKVVTAAAALALLGPEYYYETALYSAIEGPAVAGPLVLRGRGDPTLTLEDLEGLAAELRRSGVRVVRGDLVVDATFFDDETEPPAFDQQPGERSYFRAPVGGVNVNRNVVTVNVRPAAAAGRPAIVVSEPEGALDVMNDTVTVEGGAQEIRFSTRPGEPGTRARVWGSIPLGDRGTRQRSRIDDPALFAGAALAEALRYQGIRLQGVVREGELPTSLRMIAHHRSEPLSSILWLLGKQSDNFTAEAVLKTMGTLGTGNAPGTWERAREAVRGWLESIGLARDTYRLVNGSGLFDANRFSARQLATVLRAVWNDQTIRNEFVSQLAIGGVDGTLSGRYREAPMLRNVRAKTGTLASVTALSGYVLAPPGRSTVAFSIMINGAGGVGRGRALQEDLVSAVARHLHR